MFGHKFWQQPSPQVASQFWRSSWHHCLASSERVFPRLDLVHHETPAQLHVPRSWYLNWFSWISSVPVLASSTDVIHSGFQRCRLSGSMVLSWWETHMRPIWGSGSITKFVEMVFQQRLIITWLEDSWAEMIWANFGKGWEHAAGVVQRDVWTLPSAWSIHRRSTNHVTRHGTSQNPHTWFCKEGLPTFSHTNVLREE